VSTGIYKQVERAELVRLGMNVKTVARLIDEGKLISTAHLEELPEGEEYAVVPVANQPAIRPRNWNRPQYELIVRRTPTGGQEKRE